MAALSVVNWSRSVGAVRGPDYGGHVWCVSFVIFRSRPLFWLFENVSGMRLGRKVPAMLEKVNFAALWS